MTVGADGTVTYDTNHKFDTLAQGETASDSYTYTITDEHGASVTKTETITITGTNDGPTANNHGDAISQNASVTLNPLTNSGVNAHDIDHNAVLSQSIDTSGTKGSVSVAADGTVTYDTNHKFDSLAEGQTTTDSYKYTITDEHGAAVTRTETITITGTNDGPTAGAHGDKISQNDQITLSGSHLASDVDQGAVLTVQSIDATGLKGTVTLNNGVVTYDTNHQFDKLSAGQTTSETFTYTVKDEHGATITSTETITITGTNEAPTANNHGDAISQNAGVTLNPITDSIVGAADIDNGTTLSLKSVGTSGTLGTVAQNGNVITYSTNHAFDSLAAGETATDHFTYTIKDEHGATVTKTETITITGTNDGPTIQNHGDAIGQNASVTLTPVSLASDVDHGAQLSLVSVSGAAHGTVTVDASGHVTYDTNHQFDYLGQGQTATDSYTYTVKDEHGATVTGTETITITGANDGPTGTDGGIGVAQDSKTTINLLDNASDKDQNHTLHVTNVDTSGLGDHGRVIVSGDTVTFDTNGKFTDLGDGQTASVSFKYTVTDDHGSSVVMTETVTVHGVNDAPTALDLKGAVGQEQQITLDALKYATDPDANDQGKLHVSSVDATAAHGGSVSINGAGEIVYDAHGKFVSLAAGETTTDSFQFTVSDGHGGSITKTAVITVTGVNDAPTGSDHGDSVAQNAKVTVDPLASITDPDKGATVHLQSIDTTGLQGTAYQQGDKVVYDTNHQFDYLRAGETATTSFKYTVTDEFGATVTKTEVITIQGAHDAPGVPAASLTVGQNDDGKTLNLLHGLSQIDTNDVLSISIDTSTITHGTVTVDQHTGIVTFSTDHQFDHLAEDATEVQTFKYTVTDQDGHTITQTATITVLGKNEAPVGLDHGLSVTETGTASLTPQTGATDVDDNATLHLLTVDISNTTGRVIVSGNDVTYDTNGKFDSLTKGETTTDTFQYTISDEHGGHDTKTVTVTITGTDNGSGGNSGDETTWVYEDGTRTLSGSGHLAIDTTGTVGKVTTGSDGTVTYDPNGKFEHLSAGERATDHFTFTGTDGHTHTETVTIYGENDAPMAANQAVGLSQNDQVTIDGIHGTGTIAGGTAVTGLTAATDIDNSPTLHLVGIDTVSASTQGTVRIDNDKVSYDTNHKFDYLGQGETATDQFKYTVTDEYGATDTKTITITITGTNDAPTVSSHADTIDQNGNASITPLNLASDIDQHHTLSVQSIDASQAIGKVTVNADGSVSYDTNHKFDSLNVGETATDHFTYTITDEHGATVTGTETITIVGKNDAPTAIDHTATVGQEGQVTISAIAGANDVDQGDTMRLLNVDISHTTGRVIVTGTDVVYDASTHFKELAAGETATDSFTYTLADSHGASVTKTVTVTITGSNDGPEVDATKQTPVSVSQDGHVTIDGLSGASDVDKGDVLHIGNLDTSATVGTVTVNGDQLTYDTNGKFTALAQGETATDHFTYTISDGHGGTITQTQTVTIVGANDAPTGDDQTLNISQGGSTAMNILDVVSDADHGAALRVTGVDTSGLVGNITVNGGQVSYNAGHAFDSLGAGQTGSTSFTYTVSDEFGATLTKTATIVVTGVNDGPVVGTISGSVSQEAHFSVNPITQTDSVTGAHLVTDIDANDQGLLHVSGIDTSGTLGTVTLVGDSITYDAAGKFTALDQGQTATDSFKYTVSDGHGGTTTQTITVTITGTNDAPIAGNLSGSVSQDGHVSFTPLTTASDPDAHAGAMHVTAIDTTGTTGHVTLSGDTVAYDAAGKFTALGAGETATDTFKYQITDDHGGTTSKIVTVTITGANDAPTIDTTKLSPVSVSQDGHATINGLAGASDPDAHDVLQVGTTDTTGTIGSVTVTNNVISYDAADKFTALAAGETTTDSFKYTVSDGHGGTVTQTVVVTITGSNDGPIAINHADSTNANASLTLSPLTGASDPDHGDHVHLLSIDGSHAIGTVTIQGDQVVYDPTGHFSGLAAGATATDSFTYTITDDHGATVTKTETITVTGVAPPVVPHFAAFHAAAVVTSGSSSSASSSTTSSSGSSVAGAASGTDTTSASHGTDTTTGSSSVAGAASGTDTAAGSHAADATSGSSSLAGAAGGTDTAVGSHATDTTSGSSSLAVAGGTDSTAGSHATDTITGSGTDTLHGAASGADTTIPHTVPAPDLHDVNSIMGGGSADSAWTAAVTDHSTTPSTTVDTSHDAAATIPSTLDDHHSAAAGTTTTPGSDDHSHTTAALVA